LGWTGGGLAIISTAGDDLALLAADGGQADPHGQPQAERGRADDEVQQVVDAVVPDELGQLAGLDLDVVTLGEQAGHLGVVVERVGVAGGEGVGLGQLPVGG